MAKFTLDTNVLIDALNQPARLHALGRFLSLALPRTFLSAIVVQELEAGATTIRQRFLVDQQLVGPFERRSRLFAPTTTSWRRAGELIARGVRVETPSALNDLLLALSCREAGVTIITRDRDFRRLARHIPGLSLAEPFPDIRASKVT